MDEAESSVLYHILSLLSHDDILYLKDLIGLDTFRANLGRLLLDQPLKAPKKPIEEKERHIIGVDIGGTRTKFMYFHSLGPTLLNHSVLPACSSSELWTLTKDNEINADVADIIKSHIQVTELIEPLNYLVFSVPGTLEYRYDDIDGHVGFEVRNMPSYPKEFCRYNFATAFRPSFPNTKIRTIPDTLAAALGVATRNKSIRCGLVLILGTTPAVATFYWHHSRKEPSLEISLSQSWVWFTKIRLQDNRGYYGGISVRKSQIIVRPKTAKKVPHHQSRIRFALDDSTWSRLIGRNPDACNEPPLSKSEASEIWTDRVKSALQALAMRLHQSIGKPEKLCVLGGNATWCLETLTKIEYVSPDFEEDELSESRNESIHSVPVEIARTDIDQQEIHMSGLYQSLHYKIRKIMAMGEDPLLRGWTRGGETYFLVPRNSSPENLEN